MPKMLTDPQSVTISAVPITLPRVSSEENESEYLSNDGLVRETISHSYGKRTRRVFRIDHSKITADPFKPAENVSVGCSIYTVFDVPRAGGGYTAADVLAIWVGAHAQLSATSNALVTKILGGES